MGVGGRRAHQRAEGDEAALGSGGGREPPAELARREERLTKIDAAMRRLEAQAKAEAQAERQRRAEAEAERARAGQTRRGKASQPVVETPAAKARINLRGPKLLIFRTTNKGWGIVATRQEGEARK